ncbi:MAG: hypothetical protein ACXWR1_20240 [Bdellovibrionota bacterium]
MRLSLIFILTPALTGCGLNGLHPATSTASSIGTGTIGALSVTQFTPASGNLAGVPATVQIQFSSSSLNITQATLASNYTMACSSSAVIASNVAYTYGNPYVTVTIPAITVSSGDTCSLIVSLNVTDTAGNQLSGTREADYFMTAASSAFSWNEQTTTIYTSAMGGSGGGSFNDAGADGLALSGLNLYVNTLIMGVNGAWTNGAGTVSYGGVHGSSPTATSLSCPSGYRVTGLYGYYGAYVNGVGLYCKNSSQSLSYTSPLQGSASGSSFTVSCDPGQFATSLYGSSGAYVDAIGIGCR